VCLHDISKSCERILMKFCGELESGQGRKKVDFGVDPDFFVDNGSFFQDSSQLGDRA